jgi:hypothetical protein
MADRRDEIIEKVLKLMEMAKDTSGTTDGEKANANKLAAKLMADYSLEFADIRVGAKPSFTYETFELDMNGDPVNWAGTLANRIAQAFDVRVIQRTWNNWQLVYCGTKNDITLSVYFFTFLKRTVGKMSSKYTRAADRETFAFGMVKTIGDRMEDLYKARNASFDSNCSALMVVKTDGLEKYVKDAFPNLSKSKSVRLNGSTEAHEAGRAAGHKVNISRPIGGSSGASVQQSISSRKH